MNLILMSKLLFIFKLIFYSIVGNIFSFFNIIYLKKKLELKQEIFKIKLKKDVPFVIYGTSDSINNLTLVDREKLIGYNSIGLNYFVLSDIIPDIFLIELIAAVDGKAYLDNLSKIFDLRKNEFKNTLILIKSNYHPSIEALNIKYEFLSKLPPEIKTNLRFCVDFPIPSKSLKEYKMAIKLFKRLGLFKLDKLIFLPNLRASLGVASCIAIRYNPKEIIYAGVDLNHRRTFFQNEFYEKKYQIELIKKELFCTKYKRHKLKEVHRTINSEFSKVTIVDVIRILKEKVAFHSSFSVLSRKSELRKIMRLKNHEKE